jgi:hypothetical protein
MKPPRPGGTRKDVTLGSVIGYRVFGPERRLGFVPHHRPKKPKVIRDHEKLSSFPCLWFSETQNLSKKPVPSSKATGLW